MRAVTTTGWLAAATIGLGLGLGLAMPAGTASAQPAPSQARAAPAAENDEQAEWRFNYEQAVRRCAAGSGSDCDNAASLAPDFVPRSRSAAVQHQYRMLGCQLLSAQSCRSLALEADAAGRRAEAWAFAMLSVRTAGRDPVSEPIIARNQATLPGGGGNPERQIERFGQSPGFFRAVLCAGFWASRSPDSAHAAAWRAAAQVEIAAPDAIPGQLISPDTARAEADRWIEDIRITWLDDRSAHSEDVSSTTAQCGLGLGQRPLTGQAPDLRK
jgi:hypothetical protein